MVNSGIFKTMKHTTTGRGWMASLKLSFVKRYKFGTKNIHPLKVTIRKMYTTEK
jgi:folate-dependent phosphoribosylglycinamide formyltransferase PurN